VAPRIAIAGAVVNLTVSPTVAGRRYQVQRSDTLANGSWVNVGVESVGDGSTLVIPLAYEPVVPKRFYRLALDPAVVPEGFVLIPAGPFQMGDQSNPLVGYSNELPVHTVQVSGFFMGKYEVTKEEWDAVRAWGLTNGYTDLAVGNGGYASKGANHPVHSITWSDMVKWCNARSQKEGLSPCYSVGGSIYKLGIRSDVVCNWSANGHRLPTEAEWEKAARGGVEGKNFAWGDTISQSQANYMVYSSDGITNYFSYDVTPRPPGSVISYLHPVYAVGNYPWSSPVGSFAPNGYGIHDMAGNVWEWCWDSDGPYAAGSQTDPRGPSSDSNRVIRGGSWLSNASSCRAAYRSSYEPADAVSGIGFRVARSLVP
jgi:formylglycine-generating enzyme required for sulfatase activity